MEYVNKPCWQSKDFYLSSVIMASGASLVGLESGNHDFTIFVLDISPDEAKKIISLHWSKKLRLPTRDLIEAINELKTRIHSGV